MPYRDAYVIQRALFDAVTDDDWLLLLEHDSVYTLGARGSLENVLVPPRSVGADLVKADRGGDVTYHGPGQLVGYPILTVGTALDTAPAYVRSIEEVVIDALRDVGLPDAARLRGYPGVWVTGGGTPRKLCAIGVRLRRGRTMHGFALNVDPDLSMFGHIVPCGIAHMPVTSLRAEGCDVSMHEVVDAVARRAAERWGRVVERQDVAWRLGSADRSALTRAKQGDRTPLRLLGRLAEAGIAAATCSGAPEGKPEWLRVRAHVGPQYRTLRRTMRTLDMVTVCEEAGCPNIFECWADGTATIMINGDRCTRACGFCLVDTRHPLPLDPDEPRRVAEAVARMGLAHAVITAVARDDQPDGGASAFAATIRAVHERCPGTAVEVLISDCKGDADALQSIFDARPEVLAHNIETVPRLQRAVRPSASYSRSLAVLARAVSEGLTTKTSIILGMGETDDEVVGVMADLRGAGVDILTLGQYLRPSSRHVPVVRWWTPEEFDRLSAIGTSMGFAHVQASPLTRSSYHARRAATEAGSRG